MKNLGLFICLIFTLSFYACNPECTSIPGLRVIPPDGNPGGYEVTILSSDLEDLRDNTKVFFNGESGVNPRFIDGAGIVVGVPQGIAGVSDLRIVDPDCEHNINFDIMDEFPAFNVPSPPQVVIPVPPLIFPGDITKAWISPQDGDYCLWLGDYQKYFFLDAAGDTVVCETSKYLDGNSWELSTSGDATAFYFQNPVSGFVDQENNEVQITIDRTSKGLGTEDYVGEFVNIDQVDPETANNGKEHMILLRSQKTGRQILVFKN